MISCAPSSFLVESVGTLQLWQPLHRRELILAHAWGVRVGSVIYRAPGGMETDGASIPRLWWRVFDPPTYSLLFPAAIIHDAAYGGILRATSLDVDGLDWLPVERDEADELLALIGEWNGFEPWKCRAAYESVRRFGGAAWERGHAANAGLDLESLDWSIPGFDALPLESA